MKGVYRSKQVKMVAQAPNQPGNTTEESIHNCAQVIPYQLNINELAKKFLTLNHQLLCDVIISFGIGDEWVIFPPDVFRRLRPISLYESYPLNEIYLIKGKAKLLIFTRYTNFSYHGDFSFS